MGYKIVNMYVPSSKYRIKCPYPMNPNYIVIHNTANTASARNEAAYMRRNNNQTSYHVAGDEDEMVQCIPFNRNAWHAGDGNDPKNSGNRLALGFEIARSMDNGYSGPYSARHRQAEENMALFTAYVLDQKGWGVDRLRMHWHYTRKDCPHKMRAHNGWKKFVNRVQAHLNAIQKKGSSASKPVKKKKGATHTVKKNETLWGISKAYGVTVNQLKSWNQLSNNTIHVGQKLFTKAPPKDKKEPQQLKWNYNKHTGAQWAKKKGVWINGKSEITKRRGSPELSAPTSGQMPPGQRLDYREIARSDGHIWLLDLKSDQWVPVKKWNAKTGEVSPDWGTWK